MAQEPTKRGDPPKMKVYFGRRSALTEEIATNTTIIAPSSGDWNDFGHHTRIDRIFRVGESARWLDASGLFGYIAPEKSKAGRDLISELIAQTGQDLVESVAEHQFFTMLPDMSSYRRLVTDLGSDAAVAALMAANDLVALAEFSPSSKLLELATKSKVFSMSFMRSASTFFTFKNAGHILRGLASEQLGKLSPVFAIRFKLSGRLNEHDLKFEFGDDKHLPKRIAVIIGKNGVGKSQALSRIARAALDGDPTLTDGSEQGRPMVSRLLAFAPTNEAESVFPSDRRKQPRIWYRRYSLNRARRARRNDSVSDLIVQVARSVESIATRSRWAIFLSAVQSISEHGQLHLVGQEPQQPWISLAALGTGGEQEMLERFASIDLGKEPMRVIGRNGYPLSSGEISFLKFAAQASLHIENGSLLLLDEPETHLHPNFISRFVALLDTLLEMTGSGAIIATHSVYFVREVFREQVTILSVDEKSGVSARHPTLRTFGADVGAISYFVFGEDEPSRLASRLESELLAQNRSWPQVYEQYKDELSLEFLNGLRADIEAGPQS